ncbi:MAG: hypothetical protein GY755_09490 [Chloroflexi bacterium]|nr:hypothetical protein [Chloroflexota bacterium]
MMKSKTLFQSIVLIAVLLAAVGVQPAYAQPAFEDPDPDIVVRELTYWDATYTGYVDATRFEKWPFVFDASYDFSVTVTPTSGDLVPVVILLDAGGAELARGTGSLISTQPAGNYFVQIEPESGSGFYELMLRQIDADPALSAEVSPATIAIDESSVASIGLNDLPEGGYTSAEFSCTYPVDVVSISNIVVTDLFGTDSAVAISDPQDGSFIVAIAGSNGQTATASGDAFTFTATGLQAGEATITCTAKTSTGDAVLTELDPSTAVLTVEEAVVDGIVAGQVLASKAVTVNLYNPDDSLAATVAAEADGTFSLTAPAGTYTVEAVASGFVRAEGSAVIVAGETTTMPTVTLIAGDIDGNDVVDQYDAMTIGMSYNTATPDAADLNGDAVINVLDLEIVATNYNQSGPVLWE